MAPALRSLLYYISPDGKNIIKVISHCISKMVIARVFVWLCCSWFVVLTLQTLNKSATAGINKE
jgi:hypothetical protein